MLLVFLPTIGSESARGASRWLDLGPISFQPSEFLKIAFILYLSAWFDKRKIDSLKIFAPFLVVLGIIGTLLILQPDVSTLGIITTVALIICFIAKAPILYIVSIILAGGALLGVLIKTAPYRLNRFMVFLDPTIDPMGIGYQLKQSLITIGSGGIFGQGLGLGKQKFGFLPEAMSDSIFSIFLEATGFLGALFLIILFLLFCWQAFKISKNCNDKFSKFVIVGIASWIAIQGFINMGAMIGILPLTGIPLPFISYGGSHLIAEFIALGILLNVSRA